MRHGRVWAVCSVIVVLGLVADASEEPSEEYIDAMKTLAIVAQGMSPAIDAGAYTAMNELVILARPALAVLEKYWMEREVEDATDLARAASKSIAEIAVAVHLLTLSQNPLAIEGAQVATRNFPWHMQGLSHRASRSAARRRLPYQVAPSCRRKRPARICRRRTAPRPSTSGRPQELPTRQTFSQLVVSPSLPR